MIQPPHSGTHREGCGSDRVGSTHHDDDSSHSTLPFFGCWCGGWWFNRGWLAFDWFRWLDDPLAVQKMAPWVKLGDLVVYVCFDFIKANVVSLYSVIRGLVVRGGGGLFGRPGSNRS